MASTGAGRAVPFPAVPLPIPTRADFLLDPDLVFLNHGSFGAVPRVVQEAYEHLQREMERNPVEWLARRSDDLLGEARARVATFVGASADDLVFFPNPTTGINMVVHSLRLRPGDQVVSTDHEYGAMIRTWRKYTAEAGAEWVPVEIPLPVTTEADFVERVWSAVTERTRVLFLSHITSATALVFPVAELCRRARAAGILTIVDGAHVPNHIPLDIGALDCDVYAGALNKWVCAPKGSAFVWARPEVQQWLQPLVVSWGWESDHPGPSQFVDHHQWQGTRDLSPFLAVPAALDFVAAHDWAAVRAESHRLAVAMRDAANAHTGLPALSGGGEWLGQMAAIHLPEGTDVAEFQARLFQRHRVEVPCSMWNGRPLLRVSCNAHTSDADVEALTAAISAELPAG